VNNVYFRQYVDIHYMYLLI